jgi:hypothetical protein
VLFHACTREVPQKPYVARVDQALLTEDELAGQRDSLDYAMPHRRQYINEWVNTELLYQEAARRGLADNPQIRREVEDTKRRLAVAALLQQELYGEENVNEDEIVTLYNGGGEVFRLQEDLVKASYALFRDREAANSFRGKLVRGTSWEAAVEECERDSLLRAQLAQVATRQYFTQSTLYPPELWKLARNLGKDEVSFAVKTPAGYYVLVVQSFTKQGDMPELNYIRDEIRERILIEKRRVMYDRLLAELRAKHSVEVKIVENDSTSQTLSSPE